MYQLNARLIGWMFVLGTLLFLGAISGVPDAILFVGVLVLGLIGMLMIHRHEARRSELDR